MFTIACLTILAYAIMGRDFRSQLAKVRHTDWAARAADLKEKLRPYAMRAGRTAARPLLCFYYVLTDEETLMLDKVLIYAAIFYTVSPVSLIPSAVYKLMGVLDEGAAVLYVYRKVKARITPNIEARVQRTLDDWFGVEYEVITEEADVR